MTAITEPFCLYVHIPFCIRKCPYCDFNSHVVQKIPEAQYTEALLQELSAYGRDSDWSERRLKTVFFGGGTPSTFSAASIGNILERASTLFGCEDDAEIALEANPGTVDSGNFHGYRRCGVNRISIGAQSFQPELLKFLGRAHSAEETRQALKVVRAAGFDNFNLDLIYACPGQSVGHLEADLEEALSFSPPHLSAYNLTIEEGTPFYHEYRAGRLRPLPDEEEIAMAELVEDKLKAAGLERYEISNYARPGCHSRHNLNYWQGGDYLGVGAGAHSYRATPGPGSFGHRWHNEKSPGAYMERIRLGAHAVAGEEKTDLRGAAGEFMFMGLRLIQGISTGEFAARFGQSPSECYPEIDGWIDEGLMETQQGSLRLTPRGLLVANSLFTHFV